MIFRDAGRGGHSGRLSFLCWKIAFGDLSGRHHAVIVVHLAIAGGVAPVPVAFAAISGRTAQLVLGDAGAVAAKPCIVFQRLPGQGIVIVAEPEETAEAEHGVGHPAADLVDHDALDRADLALVRTIDGGALDLVAADQIAELALVELSFIHCHFHSLAVYQPVGASPRSFGVIPEPGVFSASFSLGSRVASREPDFFGSLFCVVCARSLSAGCSSPRWFLTMPCSDALIWRCPSSRTCSCPATAPSRDDAA